MKDTPRPSEVRARILAQHRDLRRLLTQVRSLADQVLAGDRGLLAELRRQAVELELVFLAHLETEEAILLPVLEGIDVWGPVRVRHIRKEHEQQRSVLERAGDSATSASISPQVLASSMRALVDDLLEDMKGEERDMLNADLLRDDVVVEDQSDG